MTKLSQKDLAIFEIPEFEKRMPLIKEKIRPKLEELGEELAPLLMKKFQQEFFPHTAKHMRRKVNPPDETWVALGPQSRGYKAYVYFAFCVGKAGIQARVVMKDESPMRKSMGENLQKNLRFFESQAKNLKGLKNYLKRNEAYQAETLTDIKKGLSEIAERLINLKSATFDLGLELSPQSPKLRQEVLKSFEKLFPFYQCGLKEKVKLKN